MKHKERPGDTTISLAIGARHFIWRKNILSLLACLMLLGLNVGAIGLVVFVGWLPPLVVWLGLLLTMLCCVVLALQRLWRLWRKQA